jgi:cytochrome c-type biogenesis protein CcmF
MNLHDTLRADRNFIILEDVKTTMVNEDVNNASIVARLKIMSMSNGSMETEIKYEIVNGELKQTDGILEPMNLKLRFEGVAPDSKAIHVGIYERQQDYIVMKAIVFPFIGVLWLGIVVMFSGLTYSIMRRTMGKNKDKEIKN